MQQVPSNFPYLLKRIQKEPDFLQKLNNGYRHSIKQYEKGMAPYYTWEKYLKYEEWNEIARTERYSWQHACH